MSSLEQFDPAWPQDKWLTFVRQSSYYLSMATISLRELARNTSGVIQDMQASGRPALVTRNGKPVAALVPIDAAALEEWLLGRAAAFTRAAAEEDPDLAAGRTDSIEWQRARDGNGGAKPKRPAPPDRLRGSHRGE
jgi:prevent-host-death family protein